MPNYFSIVFHFYFLFFSFTVLLSLLKRVSFSPDIFLYYSDVQASINLPNTFFLTSSETLLYLYCRSSSLSSALTWLSTLHEFLSKLRSINQLVWFHKLLNCNCLSQRQYFDWGGSSTAADDEPGRAIDFFIVDSSNRVIADRRIGR